MTLIAVRKPNDLSLLVHETPIHQQHRDADAIRAPERCGGKA
jgi:hypothetical protein